MKKKIVILLGIFCIFLYICFSDVIHIPIFCPIYKLTHLYCPGCGITRMFKSLIVGNFYQAFRYNPLVFILLPFVLFYLIDMIVSQKRQKKMITSYLEPYLWYVLIGIFVFYGILRNIPYFEFLQPVQI